MADQHQSHETMDQWECTQSHRPIPTESSPLFNTDGCSCVEVAIQDDVGVGGDFPQQPVYPYMTEYHQLSTYPLSYASSVLSEPAPEGPEREDPQASTSNTYLPLGPAIGLNEDQHQRTSTIREDMSFQMQRFLCERGGYGMDIGMENTSHFLPQDLNLQSLQATKKKKKRSRSKVSFHSMQSCGSAHSLMSMRYSELAADSWGLLDPVTGTGTWLDHRDDSKLRSAPLWTGEFFPAGVDDGPGNVLAGQASMMAVSPPERQIQPSFASNKPIDPSLTPPDEGSHPLPPAWMTRSSCDEEHQSSFPEPPLRARNKPEISIIALATAAVFLRRWIRRKHPSATDNPPVSAIGCVTSVSNIVAKEKQLTVSSQSNEGPISGISNISREEESSSPCADSVNSLNIESTEDSDDDELALGHDDYATSSDFLHGFSALLRLYPNELSIELGRKLELLTEGWFNNLNFQQHPGTASETPQCSSFNEAESNLTTSTTPSGIGKKRASSDEHGSSPPDDRGGGSGKRPKNTVDRHRGNSARRWACPYYQREPHRYCLGKWRLCAKSPGFSEVHRVKAHIYDRHAAIYCERCYTAFESKGELSSHTRQLSACEVRSPRPMEGLTKEQKDLLRPRDRNRSEEERWRAVYKICFPDDDSIPSPYFVYYSRETAELRHEIFEILRQEIPQIDELNHERLFQRVHNAFEVRSNAAEGTLLQMPSTHWTEHDPAIEDPVHSSIPEAPLPLRVSDQSTQEGNIQDFMQDPVFDPFDEMVTWDHPGMDDPQMSMNETVPSELEFSFALQECEGFDSKLHWSGNETIESAG